jgi:hypothetical protein
MARLDRYRLYFLLMDVSTVLVGVSIVQAILNPSALTQPTGEPGPIDLVIAMIIILLPTLLIFASRMRDEFAEILWQKAAASTVKGLVILPFVALFIAGIVAGYREAGGAPPTPMPLDAISGTTLFGWAWMLMLSLFVLSFQWHRWRGSR